MVPPMWPRRRRIQSTVDLISGLLQGNASFDARPLKKTQEAGSIQPAHFRSNNSNETSTVRRFPARPGSRSFASAARSRLGQDDPAARRGMAAELTFSRHAQPTATT
jgi:hypothetical protein